MDSNIQLIKEEVSMQSSTSMPAPPRIKRKPRITISQNHFDRIEASFTDNPEETKKLDRETKVMIQERIKLLKETNQNILDILRRLEQIDLEPNSTSPTSSNDHETEANDMPSLYHSAKKGKQPI